MIFKASTDSFIKDIRMFGFVLCFDVIGLLTFEWHITVLLVQPAEMLLAMTFKSFVKTIAFKKTWLY